MSPTAKRALFQTPTRSNKRSKTLKARGMAVGSSKIPRSLLPETKQHIGINLSTALTNSAYTALAEDMTQGTASDDFVGSKFRMMRLRVNYDWGDLTLTDAVRLSVVIPKDPTTNPGIASAIAHWDTNTYTVLHDMLLPRDESLSAGTFDIKGPVNIEMNTAGTAVLRNNIHIYAYSTGNGSGLASDISYSLWFTG